MNVLHSWKIIRERKENHLKSSPTLSQSAFPKGIILTSSLLDLLNLDHTGTNWLFTNFVQSGHCDSIKADKCTTLSSFWKIILTQKKSLILVALWYGQKKFYKHGKSSGIRAWMVEEGVIPRNSRFGNILVRSGMGQTNNGTS